MRHIKLFVPGAWCGYTESIFPKFRSSDNTSRLKRARATGYYAND